MSCCETINTLPCQSICGTYVFTNTLSENVRIVLSLDWNGNSTCKDYGVVESMEDFTVIWRDLYPLIGVQYIARFTYYDEDGIELGNTCLVTSFYNCQNI